MDGGEVMADATMTLNMSAREMAALTELAEWHDMSKTQVMRQALRLYQLINVRVRAGERLYFSGDERRAIEFVGLGFEPSPAPAEPGGYVGDIYFGNSDNPTQGTHRWDGSEWVKMSSEQVAMLELLSDARGQRDALREALSALVVAIDEGPASLVRQCQKDARAALEAEDK